MFNNKTIVVTGGSSGIGKKITDEILAAKGRVFVLSKNEKKIISLNKKYISNKKFLGIQCDVSDENDVKDAFNFINKKTNHIYGLVNNAGINPSRNDILNTSLSDWEDTINTNLKGAFLCSKQAIKSMKKNSQGSIVNISSVAAFGMQKRVAYSSSKAGMIGFTKSLARDHASKNIRVNCICPGYVPTNLVKSYLTNLSVKEKKDLFDRHPMGKLGSPEDIAFATSFLLSNKAKWITGIALNVDGGYSIF
tara:strand:- start:8610 stop:9359 length:750 start_codon:yes stop_codon:yes gene_type:complete